MIQAPMPGTNSSNMKSHNLSAILLMLLRHESISRVAMAQALGVSTATVTNLVAELVANGYIKETGLIRDDVPGVGRPQKALQLVAQARYAIGVHIEVGIVRIAITNLFGEPVQHSTFEHSTDSAWQTVLDDIVQHIEDLMTDCGIGRELLVGVGVAASGLVDIQTGVNVIAPNLNWHDVPVRDYLSARLNLSVVIDNNVRAMAFGEALFGAARDVNAMAFVYGRVGIGAGLVVGGQLYRGAYAGAGEIGHMRMVVSSGTTEIGDNAQHSYSLEELASEPVILAAVERHMAHMPDGVLARRVQQDGLTLTSVFKAAETGDEAAQAILQSCAMYMGIALANLINIFNPEQIVLGGIFAYAQGALLPHIERTMRSHAFAHLGQQVRLQTASFGQQAGMIGAAALALDYFFYRPQNQSNPLVASEVVS